MSENVSRRKMLSLLGLGATLGFTLSGVLEPLEAEAQEAAPATPNPTAPATGSAAPAQATGTRGRNRRTSRRATRHQRRAARRGHPAAPASSSSNAIAIRAGRSLARGSVPDKKGRGPCSPRALRESVAIAFARFLNEWDFQQLRFFHVVVGRF